MRFVFLIVLNLTLVLACQETTTCPHKSESTTQATSSKKVCFQKPIDIALIIDSTASIEYERNFKLGLEFLRKFLDRFDINSLSTRVAAVMFGNGVYNKSAFNFDTYRNKRDTLNAISKMKWMEGKRTDTSEGINYMVDNFLPRMRDGAARVGIVLTDGQSTEKDDTKVAARNARSKGITMIAIGVGKPVRNLTEPKNGFLDLDELDEIAGENGFVLTVGDFSKLKLITDQLIEQFCITVAKMTAGQTNA